MNERSTPRSLVLVVGALGLIAALLFVGLEIRALAATTRTATLQRIADAQRELNLWLADDTEFRSAVAEATRAGDVGALDPTRRNVVRLGWQTVFHHWATVHDHYLRGEVSEHVWNGVALEIEELRTSTTLRWAWASEGDKFAPEFRDVMQAYLLRYTVDD